MWKPNKYQKEQYINRLNSIKKLIENNPQIFNDVVFSKTHPYSSLYWINPQGIEVRISTHHKDKYHNSVENERYENNTKIKNIVTNSFNKMIEYLCLEKEIPYKDEYKIEP